MTTAKALIDWFPSLTRSTAWAIGRAKRQTGLNLGLTPMNPFTETYAYDPVDQLIQAKYGSLRTVGYQYDATGNRESVVDGSVTTTYTANADNAYTEVGGEAVVLDANGNQAGTSGITYTYDAQNRLTSATVSGVTTGAKLGVRLIFVTAFAIPVFVVGIGSAGSHFYERLQKNFRYHHE